MKKYERKDKNEKRRLAFEKRTVKREQDLARNSTEGGSVLCMTKNTNFNRRFLATFLALVLAFSGLVVGINFSTKAVSGNQTPMEGTYTTGPVKISTYPTFNANHNGALLDRNKLYEQGDDMTITATATFEVNSSGKVTSVSVTTDPSSITGTRQYLYSSTYNKYRQSDQYYYGNGTNVSSSVFSASSTIRTQLSSLIGSDAIVEEFESVLNGVTGVNSYGSDAYDVFSDEIIALIKRAPIEPKSNVASIDDIDVDIPQIPDSAENSLVLNKSIAPSNDGSAYDLTLKSYSTANLSTYKVLEKVPTDYVLVIDQSGSMASRDMPTAYEYAGRVSLEDIAKGQYYYVDGDGNSYRVFAEHGYLYEYLPENTKWSQTIVQESNAGLRWFQTATDADDTTSVENQYYYRTEDGIFRPVTVSVEGKVGTYYVELRYKDANGNEQYFVRPDKPYYKNVFGDDDSIYKEGSFLYDRVNPLVLALYPRPTAYTYSTFLGITTGMYVNYPMYNRHVGYTGLCYRDNNGEIHHISSDSNLTSTEYCDSDGNATTSNDMSTRMYYSGLVKGTQFETRLDTLTTALQAFAKTLQNDYDSYGLVDNRVAIVGFSSENEGTNYNNMEVLTGSTISTAQNGSSYEEGSHYFPYYGANYSSTNYGSTNGTNYNGPQYYAYTGLNALGNNRGYPVQVNSTVYENALISAAHEDAAGNASVNADFTKAIKSLSAYGGTKPAVGLEMAEEIFNARSETQFTMRSGNKDTVDRNKVVIFFTDGEPGNYRYSDRYSEANAVVSKAKDLKDGGTTIFSIGVFGTSDSDPLTYAKYGPVSENSDYEYEQTWWETYKSGSSYYYLNRGWNSTDSANYGSVATDTIYDYMMAVSSNYPNATNYVSADWAANHEDDSYTNWSAMVDDIRGTYNGSNQYYRMASNEESLIAAFKSAASLIEGEETQEAGMISENSVMKDVIDTSNFNIPVDSNGHPTANVTIKKASGSKRGADANVEVSPTLENADGVTYSWGSDNKTLIVEGFNYNDNYIANGHSGYELVVTIEGITPKDGKTGDALTSNETSSGIYSDRTSTGELLKAFDVPTISRHKYMLTVGNDNTSATVNSGFSLKQSDGTTALTSSDLEKAVVELNGTRSKLNEASITWSEVGPSYTMYLENLPLNSKISNTMSIANDSINAYTYSLVATEGEETISDANLGDNAFTVNYADTDYEITSEPNTFSATLSLKTEGEFANTQRAFPIGMTIFKNDNTGYTGDITLGDGTTLSFKNGSLENQDSLQLKHGETVTFANLPANWNVTITPSDDSAGFYTWTTSVDDSTPAASAATQTINQNGHEFSVVYTRGEVTDSGILDNSDSQFAVLYVLAGMAAIAAGGTGYYGYRKRKER